MKKEQVFEDVIDNSSRALNRYGILKKGPTFLLSQISGEAIGVAKLRHVHMMKPAVPQFW